MKANKRGFCPICKEIAVGLYQLMSKPKRACVRRAFYCRQCKIVLNSKEVVYKKIIFETEDREV